MISTTAHTTAGTWDPGSAVGTAAIPEPFLDWQSVWPGTSGYEKDGTAYVIGAPIGVRLSVQLAEKSNAILPMDRPWENRVMFPTALFHDGRYHLWYGMGPCEEYPEGFVCYAESADGFTWRKPELDLYPFGGRKTNIVYPYRMEGSVFIDPTADFKMFYMESRWLYRGKVLSGDTEALALRTRLREEGMPDQELRNILRLTGEMRGAASPDGIHWTRLGATLINRFCDTQNVAAYDPERGCYVAYVRQSRGLRRAVGRSESPSFDAVWPEPRVVLEPDALDPPTDDLYTNAYSRYPGGAPFHLMFPSVYHRTRDVLDVQLAVSRDGLLWHRPERVPIIPLGAPGSGEDGGIYACPGVIPLGDERWGVLYNGVAERHNEGYAGIQRERDGVLRWAIWRRDRLVALEAESQTELTLGARECSGQQLRFNYRTEPNGWIRIELIPPTLWPAEHLRPLPSYSFEECVPLRGDSLSEPVVWNGRSDLRALKGERVAIRIRMSHAKLYSVAI